MKKLLVLCVVCLMTQTMKAQDYVDLGLPSGTLWKDKNEMGFYAEESAVRAFENQLPTKEQFEELKNLCKWTWTGSEYKITGPSGKSIVLPASGYRSCDGILYGEGSYGRYWSSTPCSQECVFNLCFGSGGVHLNNYLRCYGFSVRLVKN